MPLNYIKNKKKGKICYCTKLILIISIKNLKNEIKLVGSVQEMKNRTFKCELMSNKNYMMIYYIIE